MTDTIWPDLRMVGHNFTTVLLTFKRCCDQYLRERGKA